MKVLLFSFLLFQAFIQGAASNPALYKDFGVVGTTFEIIEEDFLEMLKKKLIKLEEKGDLLAHQQKIAQDVQKRIKRPKPVEGIQHTAKARGFIYDPSITVPYDLKDHRDQVFHKAGTKVNPLDYRSLSKPLLFIDGDCKRQVNWAMEQDSKSLIILINGSPFELMEKVDRPIYFDQEGTLTQKLGITQVPARVTQQEKHLLIEEVFIPTEKK